MAYKHTYNSAPVRRKPAATSNPAAVATKVTAGTTAAAHTYDKGYSKWEKFDVDAALKDAEDEEEEERPEQEEAQAVFVEQEQKQPVLVTPATITMEAERCKVDPSKVVKPRPRAEPDVNPEEQEREKGNEHYRRGEFGQAVRCYTRCIGYNRYDITACPSIVAGIQ